MNAHDARRLIHDALMTGYYYPSILEDANYSLATVGLPILVGPQPLLYAASTATALLTASDKAQEITDHMSVEIDPAGL